MGIVEDIEAEIYRQFDEWATTKCPAALVESINESCVMKTGRLAGSVDTTKINKGLYHVGVTAPYGGWVDEGRGSVRPVNKQYLKFVVPSGQTVFTKYSRPSTPRRFIAKAVAKLS